MGIDEGCIFGIIWINTSNDFSENVNVGFFLKFFWYVHWGMGEIAKEKYEHYDIKVKCSVSRQVFPDVVCDCSLMEELGTNM